MTNPRRLLGSSLLLATLFGTSPELDAQRPQDPVVLTGDDVPRMLGLDPTLAVAFRHGASGWEQIPVQVDERVVVTVNQIRKKTTFPNSVLVYADAETFTGADTDPKLDADDEICFMAADTGPRSTTLLDPAGVVADTRLELAVTDPIRKTVSFAYLFVSLGVLKPGAGKNYVSYTFNLKSGPYKTTYNTGGSNPEDSPVVTADYEIRFKDRWILDTWKIHAGTATGADILDRHKFQFVPGNCNRTTTTFSQGGGAAVANIDGPVRAIRSVIGANSGGPTQRDWICYRNRVDIVTHLRVHAIGGTFSFFDYSPAAAGMKYHDNLNTAGVTIDGTPDSITNGKIAWQLVNGSQGSLVQSLFFVTDIQNIQLSSFYDDDATPSWNQCTGDAFAYGAGGPRTGGLPNTDPNRGPASLMDWVRVVYVGAPGTTVADAAARDADARQPLVAQATGRIRTFGTSCKGPTVDPALTAVGAPMLGGTVTIRASGIVANRLALLIAGASDTRWGTITLPLELSVLGMPKCFLYTDPTVQVAIRTAATSWQQGVSVPTSPSLVDSRAFLQFVTEDSGANANGTVTTNGVEVVIGR